MNRTIYFRNLFLFLMFVMIIFVTPFVFAQDVTSPTLLRVDNANVQLRNRDNPTRTNTVLSQGSVIRLPNPIAENLVYDGDGNISMVETLRVWHSMAAEDERLRPRQINGRVYYPVKVLMASEEGYDVNGRDSVGFVAMADFLRPLSFNTVRVAAEVVEDEPEETVPRIGEPTNAPPVANGDSGPTDYTTDSFPFFYATEEEDAFDETTVNGGFDETTTSGGVEEPPVSPYAVARSIRPQMRPDDLDTNPAPTPAPVTERVRNPHANSRCENIRGRVAAALGESINSRTVNCYLDLFHTETGCRPNLPQAQGNAGNPYAAYGLCSIEASPAIRRQNNRGSHCVNIQTVEQQTRCCAAMMEDTRGRYFGPVIRGVVSRCDLL